MCFQLCRWSFRFRRTGKRDKWCRWKLLAALFFCWKLADLLLTQRWKGGEEWANKWWKWLKTMAGELDFAVEILWNVRLRWKLDGFSWKTAEVSWEKFNLIYKDFAETFPNFPWLLFLPPSPQKFQISSLKTVGGGANHSEKCLNKFAAPLETPKNLSHLFSSGIFFLYSFSVIIEKASHTLAFILHDSSFFFVEYQFE